MNQVKGPNRKITTEDPREYNTAKTATTLLRCPGLPKPNQTTGKETAGLRLEFFVPGYRR